MGQNSSPLSEAIRAIRQEMGISQTAFAEMLRTGQNTVSRYESGKLVPSTEVLLSIYNITGPAGASLPIAIAKKLVRDCIVDRSGGIPSELEGLMMSDARMEQLGRSGGWPGQQWKRFLEELKLLVDDDPSELAPLTETVRLYRKHHLSPGADAVFRRFVAWLEVELEARPATEKQSSVANPKRTKSA